MQQQYGKNYTLLSPLTQFGQPVIQGVDANGVVTLQIAVAGIAEYQFSPNDLSEIKSQIKGKSRQDALKLLENRSGIDARAVMVHLSYGNTLPNTVDHIGVVPVNPTSLPAVQLPSVTPAVNAQPDTTPTPNP